MMPTGRGLYAITPTDLTPDQICAQVESAVLADIGLVQFRDKSGDDEQRLATARRLAAICRGGGAPLIINDDVELAAASGADGVHLGRDDASTPEARARLGSSAIIGVSCYNDLALARQAAADGADYVAFGSFFPSPTKPQAVRATPELLTQAKRELKLPLVAIGGITPENAGTLIQAGADWLAVISGLFAATDLPLAAQAYLNSFSSQEPRP